MPKSVIIVAGNDDPHACVVERVLRDRGVQTIFWNLGSFHSAALASGFFGGSRSVSSIGGVPLDSSTTVWLRRLGEFVPPILQPEESALLRAEVYQAFLGPLIASSVRWVDHPSKVSLAENRIYHLEVARNLGLPVPPFLLTNRSWRARSFVGNKAVVTKALSSGPGLAPQTDLVSGPLLEFALESPFFLQERVPATADVRVVTVGERAYGWIRRRRPEDPIDWKANDPKGEEFKEHPVGPDLEGKSLLLARGLGLRFTVQDWLLARGGAGIFGGQSPGAMAISGGRRENHRTKCCRATQRRERRRAGFI